MLAAVWLTLIYVIGFGLAAANQDDYTVPVTRTITTQLEATKIAQQSLKVNEELPPGEPLIAEVPGRVPANWCTDLPGQAWDVRCFNPWWEAATIAIPAAVGTSPWEPEPGWLTVIAAGLRGAAWILTALILAGTTGLLRKQT